MFAKTLLAAACLGSFFFTSPVRASNLYSDFSATSNPNGVFSYYYGLSPSVAVAYTPAQGSTSCSFTGNTPCWYNGGAVPDAIYMAQNNTGSTLNTGTISAPANTLWLDPEEFVIVVVFTAPTTGTYNITGDFLGIDTGENSHPVQIASGPSILFNATIASFGQDAAFNFSQSLTAGDLLGFIVGTGTGGACTYCNLSTGLDGTITLQSTPEPGTLWLVAPVVVFFVRRRWMSGEARAL